MVIFLTIGGLVILVFGLAFGLGYIFSTPPFKGPPSDHFDGKKFFNPGGAQARSLKDVLKWLPERQKGPWEEIVVNHKTSQPPPAVESGIAVTFINHSSFLLQLDRLNLLTDPVFSDRASPVSFAGPKRMRPPGIAENTLPEIHGVLLSHNHYDHCDMPFLKRLCKRFDPVFVVPLGMKRFMEKNGFANTIELDWWESHQLNTACTIQATPAQHFSGRGMFDRDKSLWCGYSIKAFAGHILYVGDTGYGPFFKDFPEKTGRPDIAIIPIGAFKPRWFMQPIHCSPDEAVQIHSDIQAGVSIPCHFGTFPLADDGMREPVEKLLSCLEKKSMEGAFMVLEEGSRYFQL